MKVFNSLVLSVLLLLPISVAAQQTQMLTGDKNNEYGVVYTLPQTQLVIDAECEVRERVPGPFKQYAKRYLGVEAPFQEHASQVELTNVRMSTRGVPSDQKYLMQMKPGVLAELCVSTDGMLRSINTPAPQTDVQSPFPNPENSKAPDMNEYLQYVDADYLSSLSSAKKAQLLAETIMEIRDSRLSLSRGTAETMPADGRQLELMLASLKQQEDALTRAFNGYEHTTVQTRRFTYLPDSTAIGQEIVLFRLSDNTGFCDKDDYSGEPVYLSMTMLQQPEMPLDIKGLPKALPKNAVIYSLPATVSVSLEYKDEDTGDTQQFDFSQYGITFGLDPKLFTDKKKPAKAIFDDSTGALLQIRTEE